MRNDLFQLERVEKLWLDRLARRRKDAPPPKNPLSPADQAKLVRLRDFAVGLDSRATRAREIEEETLLALYGPAAPNAERQVHLGLLDEERAAVDSATRDALLGLYWQRFPAPHLAVVALFSESRAQMAELAVAYRELAAKWKYDVALWRLLLPNGSEPPLTEAEKEARRALNLEDEFWHRDALRDGTTFTAILRREAVDRPDRHLKETDGDAVGLVFGIKGKAAFVRLGPEDGLHVIRTAHVTAKILVQTAAGPAESYHPPPGATRRGFVGPQPRRRGYDAVKNEVEDAEIRYWGDHKLAPSIECFIEEKLKQNLESMLDE
jgi:hypothetical protein